MISILSYLYPRKGTMGKDGMPPEREHPRDVKWMECCIEGKREEVKMKMKMERVGYNG